MVGSLVLIQSPHGIPSVMMKVLMSFTGKYTFFAFWETSSQEYLSVEIFKMHNIQVL